MKKYYSIASLVIGIIGLGVFFKPVIEILCGIGGLVLSIVGKDANIGGIIESIRSWGNNLAWINILWVCLEFALKYFGIEIF